MSHAIAKLVVLLLVLFPGMHTVASAQAPEGRTVVLRGATLIGGMGGASTADAVVVIQGDRISAAGPRGTSYPSDATVIDLPGKFIIPGLVESHSHYEEWMGELFLNHGVTSVLAVGGNFGKAKETSQRSSARTPRIFDTAGDPRITAGMTEEQVREGIREWLKGKPDFSRLRDYNESSSRTYGWATDEIHKAGLIVFGHTENAPESIRAGQDVVEHVWGYTIPSMTAEEHEGFQTGRYLHWGTFLRDWDRLDQTIREAVSQGAYLNPTVGYELGSLSRWAAKHEQDAYAVYSDPLLMAYYPPSVAQSLLQKKRQIRNFSSKYENLVLLSRLTSADREEFQRAYRLTGEFLRRYVQAGGKLQAGTDTISGGTPGLSLHHEMELFVEAGLTPLQALQSATLWSAEMLAGKNGSLGSLKVGVVAPGAFADLVVLSANPLEDIANTKKIERVMKGGQFIKLGYDPAYYSHTRPPRTISMATPVPEISAIVPHTVLEGGPDFEIVIHGVGFGSNSVVRVDNVSMATTFVNPRVMRAKIPASLVKSATPNPFDAPGPEQHSGIFGDPTLSISVFNPPPEGGTSNSVSLRIRAKWMGLEDEGR
jgi:hypothetical protein